MLDDASASIAFLNIFQIFYQRFGVLLQFLIRYGLSYIVAQILSKIWDKSKSKIKEAADKDETFLGESEWPFPGFEFGESRKSKSELGQPL